MTGILRQNRGVAVIMALMMITLLVAVVVEVNHSVRISSGAAGMFRDRVILSEMAMSGIHIGQAILIQDKYDSEIDSLQEAWADPLAMEAYTAQLPFGEGRLDIKITDLRSRIQVNALVDFPEGRNFNEAQRELWYRFWDLLRIYEVVDHEIKPLVIINSVKDWLDSGDDDAVTGLEGAESPYYLELDPPYQCRNGPIFDINELGLVKGIGPDFFMRSDTSYGISSAVTAFGMTEAEGRTGFSFDGRININTAPAYVIAALLPLEDAYLAEEIVAYRDETSDGVFVHDLSSPTWYKNVPGTGDLTIDPDLITLASDFFQIEATAVLNQMRITRTAVVLREKDAESGKWGCRVLNYQG